MRIKYSRSEELKYIGHLDMMRAWHRILRRARVPLAYSEGFNPHPKMVFASPLALGILSTGELLDIYLTSDALSASAFTAMVNRELPQGLDVIQTAIVPNELPPMPAMVCQAEYVIKAEHSDPTHLENKIQEILSADHIDWEQTKKGVVKVYDIREKIYDLALLSSSDGIVE
ncbi:MAG: TIGR03936 family radical SAM-associated protein, partial [Dehalococcoidales bacterium]|nr:TIGR03936 family radical SAM-associated protein [Dehalococcoidales bacterium]